MARGAPLGFQRRQAAQVGPVQDFQASVEVLHQRRAAFHPIAVVAVEDAVDVADFRVVDVAADDAVHAPLAGYLGHGLLEIGDVGHCILDLVLQVA